MTTWSSELPWYQRRSRSSTVWAGCHRNNQLLSSHCTKGRIMEECKLLKDNPCTYTMGNIIFSTAIYVGMTYRNDAQTWPTKLAYSKGTMPLRVLGCPTAKSWFKQSQQNFSCKFRSEPTGIRYRLNGFKQPSISELNIFQIAFPVFDILKSLAIETS